MGLKHHTIIVVPHSRARFRKFKVSSRQLKLALFALVAVTVATSVVTYSYFATSVSLDEITDLREQNEQLRTINDSFEDSVRSLQEQLARYEDRTKELAIVAGLEDVPAAESRTTAEPGAGGGDLPVYPSDQESLTDLDKRVRALDSTLAAVNDRLEERSLLISTTPAILPVKGVYTSAYGYRRDPITGQRSFHGGIDISAPKGKPVVASADGVVSRSGTAGALGRLVELSHGFGVATVYGHLSKITVQPGQRIERGDVIGYVGNSGRSTGYHLHYEVRRDDRTVNPVEHILDMPRRR